MLRLDHVRMASRFAAHRLRALHPFEVQASLLTACNLHCTYCRCPDEKTALMTTAQWVDTLHGLAAVGTLRIKFQGGEPTMRKDFRQLSATAQQAGIRTAVVTNGLLFKDNPALLDHLDEVVFSLDSATAPHHDRLRGAGTHARAVEGIEIARGRGIPLFINMVVTNQSLDEIEPMLEFCAARGIGLNAQPVTFGRKYYDDKALPYALDDEQMRTMHTRLAAWKRAGRPLMFMASTYEHVLDWPDYMELTERRPDGAQCMAGRFYVHIEPNGDVHPCIQYDADLTPMNIVRDGLEAALAHTQRHDCRDCYSAYLNERKAVFALRPSALWEMVRRG
ncbi:MAG: radical SAM protein [Candidatus Binatia bacterium]